MIQLIEKEKYQKFLFENDTFCALSSFEYIAALLKDIKDKNKEKYKQLNSCRNVDMAKKTEQNGKMQVLSIILGKNSYEWRTSDRAKMNRMGKSGIV